MENDKQNSEINAPKQNIFTNAIKGIKSNNRSALIIVIFFVVIAGIITGTSITLNNSVKKSESTPSTESTAEIKKEQGIEAEKNNDNSRALKLYKEAKAQYEAAGNSQGVVDMEAKIHILEYEQQH